MLVVDAYNVLHTVGVLPPHLAGLDVPGLIRLIGLSRYGRRKITVVCDGGGSADSGVSAGSARVLFSGRHAEADDVIERLIDRYAGGGTLAVVSSDRRLRRAARTRGADSIRSEAFLEHLAADESVPPPPSGMPRFATEIPLDRYSVGLWLEEFGIGQGEDGVREASPTPASSEPPEEPKAIPDPGPAGGIAADASPSRPARTRRPARPDPASSLGERLRVTLPEPAPTPAAPPPAPAEPDVAPASVQEPLARAAPPPDLDPLVRAAIEEWRDRLTLDDLDMRRWVDGVTPLK